MRVEMARQCGDALPTMAAAAPMAADIAAAMLACGRVVLYGIGGSHYVTLMVEPLYRAAGLDIRAMSASEALIAPLPPAPRLALFVSQSGESGEIVDLLRTAPGAERRFALTLNADSTLGCGVEGAIVAAGGPEGAFAATRSIILTLAMHAAILESLGQPQADLRALLARDTAPDMTAIARALAGCDAIAFAGRQVFHGVAGSAALSLMELTRMPAIGFETGQFRHGPFEFLRPGIGVVLMRSSGADRGSIAPIATATLDAGCVTAVLDASEDDLPAGCLRAALPPGDGLSAAAAMLLALQQFNIAVALQRIPRGAGTPLRTSKVTV